MNNINRFEVCGIFQGVTYQAGKLLKFQLEIPSNSEYGPEICEITVFSRLMPTVEALRNGMSIKVVGAIGGRIVKERCYTSVKAFAISSVEGQQESAAQESRGFDTGGVSPASGSGYRQAASGQRSGDGSRASNVGAGPARPGPQGSQAVDADPFPDDDIPF